MVKNTIEAESTYPKPAKSILHTLVVLFRKQGISNIAELLEIAHPYIQETGYDDWDQGTYFYTLYLEIPVEAFAANESEISTIEEMIGKKLTLIARDSSDRILRTAVIQPILAESSTIVPEKKISGTDTHRIWRMGFYRLFISHTSPHKIFAARLKHALDKHGVSAFVAHNDIAPNREWQEEILLALRSMDALVALYTPDFINSDWTDQETGFALGGGKLVLPVRLGKTPHGFLGKIQAIPGRPDAPDELANSIVSVLLDAPSANQRMQEVLITAFENSGSFEMTRTLMNQIERFSALDPSDLDRLERAVSENLQVKETWGIPSRIELLKNRHKKTIR